MFVGDEKKIVKLVKIDSDEKAVLWKIVQIVVSEKSCLKLVQKKKSSNTESDGNSTEKTSDSNSAEETSDSNSTEERCSNAAKSNGVESSVSKSETDDSVYEVPVKKKQVPLVELDKSEFYRLFEIDKSDDKNDKKSDSSEKSDSTTKITRSLWRQTVLKISLPTVSSTFSTVAYSDSSSNDVKVS